MIEKNINDNKEKIDNPTALIEKLRQLNPGVQISVSDYENGENYIF